VEATVETIISKEENKEIRIPKVGECFSLRDSNFVYLRMNDIDGQKIFPGIRGTGKESGEYFFYAVCLNDGDVVYSSTLNKKIIILEPIGGKIRFVER